MATGGVMELTTDFLKGQVNEMAQVVESIVEATLDGGIGLEEVYQLEDKINHYHKDIDDACFKFMALKRPLAHDLRTGIACMKINSELERIADQGTTIKRYQQKIKAQLPKVAQLQKLVARMLKKALQAFGHANTEIATDVIKTDREANALHREILQECLLGMKEGELSFEDGFCSIWIAKNLERIGDLCTNIAEDVIFIEKSADVRHNPAFKGEQGLGPSRFDKFLNSIDRKNL